MIYILKCFQLLFIFIKTHTTQHIYVEYYKMKKSYLKGMKVYMKQTHITF